MDPPTHCRNHYRSQICDPNDILKPREKSQLSKLIDKLTDLNCYCKECNVNTGGIGVGIAMMEAMFRKYM